MTQEFHLSVTPIRLDDGYEYLVRVERQSPGVPLAEEQVRLPVEEWLNQTHQIFTNPMFGVTEASGDDALSAALPALKALGRQLYDHLFTGTIRESWSIAQGIAHNRQEVLRLRLELKEDRLPRLPWEVMHMGDRPLASGPDIVFSRCHANHLPLPSQLPQTSFLGRPLPSKLRILMVLAGPEDQAQLALRQEALRLQDELQREDATLWPTVELELLEHPGREVLTQTLEQGHYQVFHFSGHSNYGPGGGQLHLVNGQTGLSELLSGDDLAGLLFNNGISLAVLNSCRGAQAAMPYDFDQETGRHLAEALVKRGIPSVLAMVEQIPDQVALNFSLLFYRSLRRGYPVDVSLNRARQGLRSSYSSDHFYWSQPVLYLKPGFEGRLVSCDRAPTASSTAIPAAPTPLVSAYGGLGSGRESVLAARGNDRLAESPPADPALTAGGRWGDPALGDGGWRGRADQGRADQGRADQGRADQGRASQQGLTPPRPGQTGGELAGELTAAERWISPDSDPDLFAEVDALGQAAGITGWAGDADVGLPEDFFEPSLPFLGTEALVEPMRPTLAPQTAEATPATLTAPDPGLERGARPVALPNSPAGQAGRRAQPRLGMALGAAGIALGVALVAAFGFNLGRQTPGMNSAAQSPVNPDKTTQSDRLTREAYAVLQQGNVATGLPKVKDLIDRNALVGAQTALTALGSKSSPEINFLKGRIQWQSALQPAPPTARATDSSAPPASPPNSPGVSPTPSQDNLSQGNPIQGSVDDAIRFWQFAVKESRGEAPALYRQALGFALYQRSLSQTGNDQRVSLAQAEAIFLKLLQGERSDDPANTNQADAKGETVTDDPSDPLNSLAGMALVRFQQSQAQPVGQQAEPLNQAIAQYLSILDSSPEAFNPEALGQRNWLWSEDAIRNWITLGTQAKP